MSTTWAEFSLKLPNLDFITGARVQGLCLCWCPKPLSKKVLSDILKSPKTKLNEFPSTGKPKQDRTAKQWGARHSRKPLFLPPAGLHTNHVCSEEPYIPSTPTQSPWSLAPAQPGPRQGREQQMVGQRETETGTHNQAESRDPKRGVCRLALRQLDASYSHLRKDS